MISCGVVRRDSLPWNREQVRPSPAPAGALAGCSWLHFLRSHVIPLRFRSAHGRFRRYVSRLPLRSTESVGRRCISAGPWLAADYSW